jgi:hypothetical protein
VFILAQVNYVLKKDVLSAGGRKMTNISANYVLQGTISQTTIGSVEDTDYKGVIGFWHPPEAIPPSVPYVDPAEKSGDDVVLTWDKITTDTLGNSELMHYYVVYRNTSPSFIPESSDSIGYASHPDTVFTDAGALDSTDSYYYLVKAVDWARNQSKKSNMGYKFNKFVNENAGASSDRNWVSLPYHSEYDSVKDLTDDLSPSGTPISKITMLEDTLQAYYSWVYHPVLGWYGNHPETPNFPIVSGKAYEMIAELDDTVVLVGVNDPDGLVSLNENADATSDRNWLSIPYNAVYSTVSDITDELSPLGDPVSKITMLEDTLQAYYSWVYHPVLGWYGNHPETPNFPIEPGCGYEFIAERDTTWNPTEYSNETGMILLAGNKRTNLDIAFRIGSSVMPDRAPVWLMEDVVDNTSDLASKKKVDHIDVDVYKPVSKSLKKRSDYREVGISHIEHTSLELEKDVVDNTSDLALKKEVNYIDADVYKPVRKDLKERADYREAGISHIVHADLELEEFENLIFTVYRISRPWDVLTENSIGCVIATKGFYHLISFDAGNFMKPWQHGEEVILIIEASKQGRDYFTVVNFKLDKGVDIQKLGMISLEPIPEPDVKTTLSSVRWKKVKNTNVVGYSLYRDDERINEKVITEKEYSVQGEISLKPVIQGGYETVYGSHQGVQSLPNDNIPISYAFNLYPNPFNKKTGINYALPQAGKIEIKVYDVGGRQVKTLVSEKVEPGYYKTHWYGKDDIGRNVSAGVYFIQMNTKGFESQHKVIFVR